MDISLNKDILGIKSEKKKKNFVERWAGYAQDSGT